MPLHSNTLHEHAERFLASLKRSTGKEVSSLVLVRKSKLYCKLWGVKDSELVQFIMSNGWVEPSAADHYTIRMDLVRK